MAHHTRDRIGEQVAGGIVLVYKLSFPASDLWFTLSLAFYAIPLKEQHEMHSIHPSGRSTSFPMDGSIVIVGLRLTNRDSDFSAGAP